MSVVSFKGIGAAEQFPTLTDIFGRSLHHSKCVWRAFESGRHHRNSHHRPPQVPRGRRLCHPPDQRRRHWHPHPGVLLTHIMCSVSTTCAWLRVPSKDRFLSSICACSRSFGNWFSGSYNARLSSGCHQRPRLSCHQSTCCYEYTVRALLGMLPWPLTAL